MAKVVRGLYRIPGWAYITDGTMTFDIRELDYRAKGHKRDYNKPVSYTHLDVYKRQPYSGLSLFGVLL